MTDVLRNQQTESLLVFDLQGVNYQLAEAIGSGGQGTVYREQAGALVIKIATPALQGGAYADPCLLRKRYTRLQGLSAVLPEEVPLVLPSAVLAPPHVGYVMRRVRGHQALTVLLRPSEEFTPWFNEQTGGLARRLLLGARLARALHHLHALGISYGDLSDANVLVARNPKILTFCLIDPDNLSLPAMAATPALGTERYIAPELLRGSGTPDLLTDAWSLATLLFQLLRLGHPLLGDHILQAAPEAEQAALRGESAFVEHPEDDSNRSSHLLPKTLTTTSRLQNLFQRAFVDGTAHRIKRPVAQEWEDALLDAGDQLACCIQCHADYLPYEAICPWCDAPQPQVMRVLFIDNVWQKDRFISSKKVATKALPFTTTPMASVPRRLCESGASGTKGEETVLVFRQIGQFDLEIENRSQAPIYIYDSVTGGVRVTALKQGNSYPVSEASTIYLSNPQELSRTTTAIIRCLRVGRAA